MVTGLTSVLDGRNYLVSRCGYFTLGEQPNLHIEIEAVLSQSRPGGLGEEKNLPFLPRIEPIFLCCQARILVTIRTELTRRQSAFVSL
jgi:hypothetical protein